MYIIILEDSEVFKSEEITKDDKQASEMGLIEIINCEDMTTFYMDEWNDIPSIGEFHNRGQDETN